MIKKAIVTILIAIIFLTAIFPVTKAMAADYKTVRVKISISCPSIAVQLDGEYIVSENPGISLSRGTYTVSVCGATFICRGMA